MSLNYGNINYRLLRTVIKNLSFLVLLLPYFSISAQDMYVISYRSDWFDGIKLAEPSSEQIARFDKHLIDDKKPCALNENSDCFTSVSLEDLLEVCREKKILILIHGMAKDWGQSNKDFFNLYGLATEYLGAYDVVLAISWPGHVYWGVRPYIYSNKNARRVGKRITPLLELLTNSAIRTDVVTHSMGSKVFSRAVKHSKVMVDDVVLLAPSIFRNNLKKGHRWGDVFNHVSGKLLCTYSLHDIAFSWSSLPHVGLGYAGMKINKNNKYPKFVQLDCSEIINQQAFIALPTSLFKSRSNHSMYCQSIAVFESAQWMFENSSTDWHKAIAHSQGVPNI